MVWARLQALALAAALSFTVSAAAEPHPAGPKELKARADALMVSMHYREALELYDKVAALHPDAAIDYNRARALEGLGEYASALDALERFDKTAPEELKLRVPQLAALIADVRGHVALLVVTCNVVGANVLVRRKLEGITPLSNPIRTAAGQAIVEVQATGYAPFHKEVQLPGGQASALDVELEAKHPNDADTSTPGATFRSSSLPVGGVVTGASGLALIGAGAIFGALTFVRQHDADPDCPNKLCDAAGSSLIRDARLFATLADIGVIAGATALVVGTLMFIASRSKPHASAALLIDAHGLGGVW